MKKVIEITKDMVYEKYRIIQPIDDINIGLLNHMHIHEINENLFNSYSPITVEKYLKSLFSYVVSVKDEHLTDITEFSTIKFIDETPKDTVLADYTSGFVVTVNKYMDSYQELNKVVSDFCGWVPYVIRLNFVDSYKNVHRKSFKYKDTVGDEMKKELSFACRQFSSIDICYLAKHPEKTLTNSEYLYHATHISHMDKIIKLGLCPRNKQENALYKIFLTDDLSLFEKIIQEEPEQKTKFNPEDDRTYADSYFVVLRIKSSSVKNLFIDEKHPNSYFTTSNISPNDIEIMTDLYNWIPIRLADDPIIRIATIRYLRSTGKLGRFTGYGRDNRK